MNGVYPIDRKFLKDRAKEWMGAVQPAFWKVTLIYLLATTGLSELVNRLLPGQALLEQAQSYAANGDFNRAEYLIMQAFQGSTGLILIFASVLLSLYSLVMQYGYIGYSLDAIRGEHPSYGAPFSRFYMAGKIIGAQLLMMLFTFLWSLLFIIPGIIAAYRYQMIPYILLDDPDCPIPDAFRRSKQLMQGRKWELFVLEMSFYPWLLGAALVTALVPSFLSVIVAIACNLFLVPYQQFTFSLWYESIRLQDEAAQNPGPDFSPY